MIVLLQHFVAVLISGRNNLLEKSKASGVVHNKRGAINKGPAPMN